MYIQTLIFTAFFTVATGCFAAEKPVILWASSPVTEGETVLVHGDFPGLETVEGAEEGLKIAEAIKNAGVTVEITERKSLRDEAEKQNEETRTLVPLYVSPTCVMFRMPFREKAEFVVKTPTGTSDTRTLNAPEAWWIQGDNGRTATVGGWISVQGNNIAPKCRVKLILVRKPDKKTDAECEIPVETGNALPESVTAGEYQILYLGENLGKIRVEEPRTFYRTERFDVTQFGAVPNDGIDDTPAFLAAMERLRENKGGILYVPHGRFQMRETLELPPYSALMGEKQEDSQVSDSQIYWPDTYEPVECLVHGSHDFAVENIFLTCGNHRDGISNAPLKSEEEKKKKGEGKEKEEGKPETPKNIRIQGVTLRMLYSEFINDAKDELVRRLEPIHYVRALRLSGENVTVHENDIYCAAGGVFELKCCWSSIQRNTFSRGNIIGWNGFGGQQILFRNNFLGGANCTSFYGLPEGSENILWEGNTHENNFDGNNRETITGDLRIHGYIDRARNITDSSFDLLPEILSEKGEKLTGSSVLERGVETWYRPENELQRNGAVQLTAGKGVGQIRRIREIQTRTDGTIHVELDRPWDVLPDSASIFSITSFRRHFIYQQNTSSDSTVALQFYGSLLESLIVRNSTTLTGGFNGDSMTGELNWYNQFLSNRILCGNSYRGPRNETPARDAQLGLLSYGNGVKNFRYPLVRACVVRQNELGCGSKINVQGNVRESLVENNCVQKSDDGIVVSPEALAVFLAGNTFRNVKKPYTAEAQSVILSPAEEFFTTLSGSEVFSALSEKGADFNEKWETILKETSGMNGDELSKGIQKAREFLLCSASEAGLLKELTALQAELLTGVTLTTPNWGTAADVLQNGVGGSAPLYIQIRAPKVRAVLKMRVKPEDFSEEGWSFTFPDFTLEPETESAQNMTLTKPAGKSPMMQIPVTAELTGDGWALTFTQTLKNPWSEIRLEHWKLSVPLVNPAPQTRSAGIGYVSYNNLPKPSEETLIESIFPRGELKLQMPDVQARRPEVTEGSVIYAVSEISVRGDSPVQARLEGWTRGALVFVNGHITGTNQSRGQWGFVTLNPGVNRVEIWIYATQKNAFSFTAPRITWLEAKRAANVNPL